MSYTVTAPLVIVRDADGASHHFYQGGVVPGSGFDSEHVKQLVDGGMIVEVAASDTTDEVTFDGPPAKSADKATWEAYARHRGFADTEFDGLKKPELVELATNGTPAGEADQDEEPEEPENESGDDES